MALYDKVEGYFYLIHEEAGVPVVSQLDSCYPPVIKEPGLIIRNLLPLMLVGTIQMRGQKALSILATSLLDDSITIVSQHWSHTAKAVERQLLSTNLNEDSEDYNEIRELQEGLMQLNSHDSSKQEQSRVPFNGKEEWTAELSLLKKLYARYDQDQRFCGLTTERDLEGQTVLWSVAQLARAEGSVQDSEPREVFKIATNLEALRQDMKGPCGLESNVPSRPRLVVTVVVPVDDDNVESKLPPCLHHLHHCRCP